MEVSDTEDIVIINLYVTLYPYRFVILYLVTSLVINILSPFHSATSATTPSETPAGPGLRRSDLLEERRRNGRTS